MEGGMRETTGWLSDHCPEATKEKVKFWKWRIELIKTAEWKCSWRFKMDGRKTQHKSNIQPQNARYRIGWQCIDTQSPGFREPIPGVFRSSGRGCTLDKSPLTAINIHIHWKDHTNAVTVVFSCTQVSLTMFHSEFWSESNILPRTSCCHPSTAN